MYLHSEIYKLIKSKKSCFFMILMVLIPFIDLISNVLKNYLDFWRNPEAYDGVLSSSSIYHPAIASFLSGTGSSHIAQMLLIWMLPVFLMIVYSDSYITEYHCGYHNILCCKLTRRELLTTRFRVSFYVPFIVSLISLTINFVLAHILFWNGSSMRSLIATTMFESITLRFPNLTYLVYMIVYSTIAGACGLFCTGVSYLIPNRKIAYPIVFFVWIFQIQAPYSITFAMQPFIEYGPSYFIPALGIYALIVTAIVLFSYQYKVKHDEL